jgi:hypothetical protein
MQLKTLKPIGFDQICVQDYLLTILLSYDSEVCEAYTLLDLEAEDLLTKGHDLIDLLMANLDPEAQFDLVIPININGPLYTYLLNLRSKLPRQVYFLNESY